MNIKIAIWIINLGIKFLPDDFRNKIFINNCISTNIIKLTVSDMGEE